MKKCLLIVSMILIVGTIVITPRLLVEPSAVTEEDTEDEVNPLIYAYCGLSAVALVGGAIVMGKDR